MDVTVKDGLPGRLPRIDPVYGEFLNAEEIAIRHAQVKGAGECVCRQEKLFVSKELRLPSESLIPIAPKWTCAKRYSRIRRAGVGCLVCPERNSRLASR